MSELKNAYFSLNDASINGFDVYKREDECVIVTEVVNIEPGCKPTCLQSDLKYIGTVTNFVRSFRSHFHPPVYIGPRSNELDIINCIHNDISFENIMLEIKKLKKTRKRR